MFSEAKRCWALDEGHDQWMRPLRVTNEETSKWQKEREAYAAIVEAV